MKFIWQCCIRYCECFSSGIFCDGCNCVNCYNNVDNEAFRREAVEATLERNPNAFRPKIASSPHGTRDIRVSIPFWCVIPFSGIDYACINSVVRTHTHTKTLLEQKITRACATNDMVLYPFHCACPKKKLICVLSGHSSWAIYVFFFHQLDELYVLKPG